MRQLVSLKFVFLDWLVFLKCGPIVQNVTKACNGYDVSDYCVAGRGPSHGLQRFGEGGGVSRSVQSAEHQLESFQISGWMSGWISDTMFPHKPVLCSPKRNWDQKQI